MKNCCILICIENLFTEKKNICPRESVFSNSLLSIFLKSKKSVSFICEQRTMEAK